jgi:hypothetical protein
MSPAFILAVTLSLTILSSLRFIGDPEAFNLLPLVLPNGPVYSVGPEQKANRLLEETALKAIHLSQICHYKNF